MREAAIATNPTTEVEQAAIRGTASKGSASSLAARAGRPLALAASKYAGKLPNVTIISIGHRSRLAAFHKRGLTLVRDGERYRMKDAALSTAAG